MRVVAVDDSKAFLALVERVVRGAGHEFLGVSTWTELAKVLAREPADAVIIDASLPILAGVEIVEVTRRHWRELPIVLVSGEPGGVLELRATEAGADAYLAKTDVPKQLGRTLETVVRRRLSATRKARRPDTASKGHRKPGP